MSRSLAGVALAACLVIPAVGYGAGDSQDIYPYERFKFAYTERDPGKRTSFNYNVALRLPSDGSQPPVVEHLRVRVAKHTRVRLGAVPPCPVDDATLTDQGPSACPVESRIGTGTAAVWIGAPEPLDVNANVFASGPKSLLVVLDDGGGALAVLRGTKDGDRFEIPIPPRELGPGVRAALVKFDLRLGGGTAKEPVFRTPKTCTKHGWSVIYTPTFDIGKVKLTDVTKCRSR